MKKGLLDVELKAISGINSFKPGYIDKENEGVSVARNLGLSYANGEFVKETERREQTIAEVSENLECAFDFMERAFGESQEMVVFITELTVNFYAAKFLSENESGRFYKYNKGLLANERRASIISGIEEVEMLMNGN